MVSQRFRKVHISTTHDFVYISYDNNYKSLATIWTAITRVHTTRKDESLQAAKYWNSTTRKGPRLLSKPLPIQYPKSTFQDLMRESDDITCCCPSRHCLQKRHHRYHQSRCCWRCWHCDHQRFEHEQRNRRKTCLFRLWPRNIVSMWV